MSFLKRITAENLLSKSMLALACLALLMFLTLALSPLHSKGISALTYNGVILGAGIAIFIRGLTFKRERSVWLPLGIGMLLWSAGDIFWSLAYENADAPPFPSAADALYLAFYPFAFIAIINLVRKRGRTSDSTLFIDGIIAACAVASVGAAIVFRVVVANTDGSTSAIAVNLAYPLGDLLLAGLAIAAAIIHHEKLDRTWLCFIGGLLLFAVGDSLYLYQTAVGSYSEGALTDAAWIVAAILVAVSAYSPSTSNDSTVATRKYSVVIPVAVGITSLSMVIYSHFYEIEPMAYWLAIGSLVGIKLRLFLTFRVTQMTLDERQKQAYTDSVTGLGNSRALTRDLDRELSTTKNDVQVFLMNCDMNGFKDYNDLFGHPAGDALLERLGKRLALAVADIGTAYRLGGDEFCVLATLPVGASVESIIADSHKALSEIGDAFSITASSGYVIAIPGKMDPNTAMRQADDNMYANKRSGRSSSLRQTTDVLLAVLAERDSGLYRHLENVTKLAQMCAKEMGLSDEETAQLTHAAQLHDIGKVAIPDEILNKYQPLTEKEWRYVQQHPAVGHRIVSAAPSLKPVAALIYATHERIDGKGYPQGISGREIPLGAQIISVCDAFDAMTNPSSYQETLTPIQALTELRKGVGTQFRKEVVSAFCTAYKNELERPLQAIA